MTLLHAIEKHIERTGVSASRIGRDAVGDPRLVPDLRKGRELRPKTLAKVRAYLRQGRT